MVRPTSAVTSGVRALLAASAWSLSLSYSALAGAQATPAAAAPAPPPAPAPSAPPASASAGQPLYEPAPAAPAPDTNVSTMNNNLSLFGSFGYGYGHGTGYGLGARYQIVLVDKLLRLPPGKHDELGIEFGLDWYHVGYSYKFGPTSYDWSYNEFTPVVGLTWNFWLTDKLALYPKLDFGYRFISWNDDTLNGYDAGVGHIYFQGTGGIVYDVGAVKLRAELGWASLRLGASLALF